LIIYPNPVNSSSTLVYEIPEAGAVRVSIWNMQGQKVGESNAGIKNKGRHELRLESTGLRADRLSAGNYVLVVDVNGKQMRKQFVIQR
jgi:hypothetical protein